MSGEERLTPDERERYDRIRAKGTSHNLALILASGRAPGTDRTDERWRGLDDPESRLRGLRRRGKYQAGLARYPGDPQAIVESRADARRVAERNGWTITDRPTNSENSVQKRLMQERKEARQRAVVS